MWSNFHTHNHYCDGKGAMSDYLDQAVRTGVKYLGFSSHAPLPFACDWGMKAEALPRYLKEIETLRSRFSTIEIHRGLEVDFIPGLISPGHFASQLDYTIGAIHFVDHFEGNYWGIDDTFAVFRDGLSKIFKDNIREAITRYYALTREMVLMSPPDIVGHLDKIKINSLGHFFEETEQWYRDQIDETLKAIRKSSAIVEVNTRGQYKKKSPTTYPSPWILERIYDLGIPVTINSDAHHPEDLTREFIPALKLLQDIGFRNISVLSGGAWREVDLELLGAEGREG